MDFDESNLLYRLITLKGFSDKGITFIKGDDDEEFISYKELYKKSSEVLGYLQKKGIQPKNELVFQIEDNKQFITTFWACIMGRIIPVPVSIANNDEHRLKIIKIWNVLNNPYFVTDEKTFNNFNRLKSGNDVEEAKKHIASRSIFIEEMEGWNESGIIDTPDTHDIAFIQFSSGSTGDPKGVVVTHENATVNATALGKATGMTPEDQIMSWMPLTHDMGLIAFHLTSVMAGANHYLMPTNLFVRRPTIWLKKASDHQATHLYSPNFGYKHFLSFYKYENAREWDLSRVRVIVNGAEPISVELCKEFMDKMAVHGLPRKAMFPSYGLAESTVAVTMPLVGEESIIHNLDRRKLNIGEKIEDLDIQDKNCISFVDEGYPIQDSFVRISDENDSVLPEDIIGYIQISGKNVTSGYYNNPKATSKVKTKDGWLNTGDLGFMRNGRLTITGRAKDIIFINGQNYYPHDIERSVEDVEGLGLGKIAACGVRNSNHGSEDLVLFVVFKGKNEEFLPTVIELNKRVSNRMGLKVKEVVPLRKMLKTTSGKVQRYKLGEMYQNGEFEDVLAQLRILLDNEKKMKRTQNQEKDIEDRLLEICIDVLKDDTIGINDNFMDVGASSISLNQIAERVECLYPRKIAVTDFFTYPTIKKMAQYIDMYDTETVPKIKFPSNFIIENGSLVVDRSEFQVCIKEGLFNDVIDISKKLDKDIYTILSGIFMFLISNIAEKQHVAMQTMADLKGRVGTIKLDMQSGSSLESIFDFIDVRRREIYTKGSLPINGSDDKLKTKNKDDLNKLAVIFYRKDYMPNSINILNEYDLAIEVNMDFASINIKYIFDASRLNMLAFRDMANKYVVLLKMITEKMRVANKKNLRGA